MAIDVKICGLRTRETLEAALSRGASHVGFVSFPKSPRHLEAAAMAELSRIVGGRAEIVIVAVDPSDSDLETFRDEVGADWVQLHGREPPERVAEARERFGLKAMKALPVAAASDLAAVAEYRDVADRVLLDSRRPKGSVLPGGNGVSFDWHLLAALDPALSPMLSGGLDARNVAEAVRVARPGGLDVSSGVESAPGVKDVGRIHAFFDALEEVPDFPRKAPA